MTDPVREFARLATLHWVEGDDMDINGKDLENWLIKSGLIEERPITKEELANSFNRQPGDKILAYSDTMKDLIRD